MFESEESCLKTCKEYSLDSASAECQFSVSGDGDEFFAVPMIMCFQEHKRFRFNKKLGTVATVIQIVTVIIQIPDHNC